MESSTRRTTTQKRKTDKKRVGNITHTQFKNGPVAKKKKFICSKQPKLSEDNKPRLLKIAGYGVNI